MALIVKDRVLETSTTTGTGAFTLAGAVTGFRAFSAVCSVNDTFYYLIEAVDANGVPTGNWETGIGTYSAANTLTRTTVSDSSNGGSAVSFGAGTKRVSIAITERHIGLLARTSVTEDFYRIMAEANMTIGHGTSGTLFDKVVDKGGLVILALGGSAQGLTWRTGTSYVVPTGKIAMIVDAKFSANVMNNWSFYKHRLFNVTTASCNVAANSNGSGGGVNSVSGWSNFTATWPSPEAAINSDIPFPVSVAVAGESIRAELAGGSDGNSRPVFGVYVVAIIDATTHLMGTLA